MVNADSLKSKSKTEVKEFSLSGNVVKKVWLIIKS